MRNDLNKMITKRMVAIFAFSAFLALGLSAGISTFLSNEFIKKEITKSTEISNRTLTQVFVNETYPSIKDHLQLENPAVNKMNSQSLETVDQAIKRFAKNTDILKVKIFNKDGITIYSSDASQIGNNYADRPGFINAQKSIITSEQTFRENFKGMHGSIQQVHLVSSYIPIKLDNGKIVGVSEIYSNRSASIKRANEIAYIINTTIPLTSLAVLLLLIYIVWYSHKQQQKQFAELRDAKQKAIKASHAKSEFLAIMSHEIRTPLNGVIATLSLIDKRGLDNEQVELIETALSSSDILTAVINDILDYSKIEANKFKFNLQPLSLDRLVQQILDSYSSSIESKGLRFSVHSKDIEGKYVLGDEVRIKQIINNYLNNAIKFTEQGFIKLDIEALPNQLVKFSVSDSGIGIKKDAQHLLFKDFSQVHSGTKRTFRGTGLGLSICKKLAIMMDGEVAVSSEIGEGSTFSVTLTLPNSEPTKAPIETNFETPESSTEVTQAINILVVEDNKVNQLIVSKLLKLLGYSFHIEENGQSCLDYLEKHSVDLILMDCSMPIMDGYEATTALRNKGYSGTIIALTANAQESDKQACFNAGMDDYLSKPFKKEELAKVIKTNLAK